MTADPKRLMEDGPSPLADMLRVAQDDVLSEEGVERVHAGLAAAGIVVGTISAVAAVGAKPIATAGVAKLFGISLVKIGIAALALSLLGGGVFVALSVGEVRAPAPAASTTAAPPPAAIAPPPPPVASTENVAITIDTAAPSASSPPPPRPVAPPPSSPKPPPAPPVSASAASAPVSAPPTIREGALLLDARRSLDSDPARSLALVQQHQKEFPTSQLAPERSRIEQEARKRIAGR